MSMYFPLGFLFSMILGVNCDLKLTNVDVDLIGKIRKRFNSQYLVFVDNSEDVSFVGKMKYFESDLYFTVVNSSYFEKIFESNITQFNFFQRRTTIVTKEDFNLTSLLEDVYYPYYLTWIVFKNYSQIEGLYIPMNSKVFFVQSTKETVSVQQVYHIKSHVKGIIRSLDWENQSVDSDNINFQRVAMNLLFLTPRATCNNFHKKILLRKLECVQWNMIELIGEKLNFSINPVECMEKKYPFIYPNGTDSELFMKLKNREVDFSALGHVISTREERYYMDFVWPTFALKSMMYLKRGKLAGRWASYLKPLESTVWWGILFWIIVFGFSFLTFEKLLLKKLKFNINFLWDLIFSTMKSLQIFCNQAISEEPEFYSVRIIYFMELFAVLIFFQAYSGYLVSSLTVVASRFPFLDLKGFFANEHYQLMTLGIGFHQFYFRRIVGKGQRKNFILPQKELPRTIQQAVDKLCDEKNLAFAEFKEDFLNFESLKCEILELPTPALRLYTGIALPTHAPHKEHLRRVLLTLRSTGIMNRYSSTLSSQANFHDKNSANDFTSVEMSQIFSVFILLGFGILLSLIIFAVEMLIKNIIKQYKTPLRKRRKK